MSGTARAGMTQPGCCFEHHADGLPTKTGLPRCAAAGYLGHSAQPELRVPGGFFVQTQVAWAPRTQWTTDFTCAAAPHLCRRPPHRDRGGSVRAEGGGAGAPSAPAVVHAAGPACGRPGGLWASGGGLHSCCRARRAGAHPAPRRLMKDMHNR